MELVIFPDMYEAFKDKLTEDSIVFVKGNRDKMRGTIIPQQIRVVHSA